MGLQVPFGLDSEISEKVIYGQLKKYLGEVFRELALRKESKVLEGQVNEKWQTMLSYALRW